MEKNFQFITDTGTQQQRKVKIRSETPKQTPLMEEDAQKMVALKKAYADIILNTAKEAAARIMVSERKAIRFQQDLCSTKDEALRMLVRLKQMMDSKINDAEMTSLSQQRRIEGLEEQLHEAEQIILDLRTELKQAQDDLKAKNNQVQPLNGQISKEDVSSHENTAYENKLNTSESIVFFPSDGPEIITTTDMKNAPLNQRILDNRCCDATAKRTELSSDSHLENNHSDNPDIAAIIMRSKKPEQYRNGCTQRIRAIERNLMDGKLPARHVDDQLSLLKNESIIKLDEKGEGPCSVPSPKAESMDTMKKPTGMEEVTQLNSSAYENRPMKIIRRRKRKIRYGNAKKTSCKSHPLQLMKPSQPSSLLPRCKTHLNSANEDVKPAGARHVPSSPKVDNMDVMKNSTGLEEKLQHIGNGYEDQAIKVIPRRYRNKKVKYRDTITASFKSVPGQLDKSCPLSSLLSRCKTHSYSINGNVKSVEDMLEMTENNAKTGPFPHLDPEVSSSGAVQNATDNDAELTSESVLVLSEHKLAESSRVPSRGTNLEIVDVPLTSPDLKDAKASEANNGVSVQSDNGRLLKYTFCRKRKKESLSNPNENTSLEKSSMKRRAGEKLSGAPDVQKSCLIDESSRDSRRLAQVARQLISLSGKRWW
ncbi:hypothetical protein L1049_002223 [Liquidambar formosana]|uniref:Uncharacterized protein n=1 Tax=Liquidambar formosana TaxID=63359 RepID=A0AAP0R8Q8_LIQFO